MNKKISCYIELLKQQNRISLKTKLRWIIMINNKNQVFNENLSIVLDRILNMTWIAVLIPQSCKATLKQS